MNWHHLFLGITLHSLHAPLPGYRVVRLLPRGVVDVHSDSTLDNLFALSNYLFCRDAITTQRSRLKRAMPSNSNLSAAGKSYSGLFN
jgi:hypothetical protein